jgi:hypothetical protein
MNPLEIIEAILELGELLEALGTLGSLALKGAGIIIDAIARFF